MDSPSSCLVKTDGILCFIESKTFPHIGENTMKKANNQPDIDLFAFQMPTVLDKQGGNNKIITADWQSKRIIEYEYNGRFKSIKDLRQVQM